MKKQNAALKTIIEIMVDGHPVVVAWSGGKDSSVVLNLCLNAAVSMQIYGMNPPPIVVVYADTGIDNPVVANYVNLEISKIKRFADVYGLDLTVEKSSPNLSSCWQMRIIGGNGLPTFPASSRACAVDLKINPMARLRKTIIRKLKNIHQSAVTMIGTRYSESDGREQRMREREESTEVWSAKDGQLYLSLIATWDVEDVWNYISACMDGRIESYSDFRKTFELYSDASESSCAIIADIEGGKPKRSEACGARFGCMLCTATNDKSMKNMIQKSEYAYLTEIHRLQQFILKTQYDLKRRCWIGRTINEYGYIQIFPDVYSPTMLLDLLRYALTIDVNEQIRSEKLATEPRFQLIGAKELIGIDSYWSLYGYHKPFTALREYRDIYFRGKRFLIPDIRRHPRIRMPPPRYYYIGDDWDEGYYRFSGFRDPMIECFECIDNQKLNDGRIVLGVETNDLFTIDEYGASMALELELDRMLRKKTNDITYGYKYHSSEMGYVIPAKKQLGRIDSIMRRTNFRSRHGLNQEIDLSELWQKTVSKEEMTIGIREPTKKRYLPDPFRSQLSLPGF